MVTRVLLSRDSEIREAIVRIAKTNTILKRPVKNLFAVENTYPDTNQTDKVREQVQPLNITNIKLLIKFHKTQDVFPSVTEVFSILLTTASTSASV